MEKALSFEKPIQTLQIQLNQLQLQSHQENTKVDQHIKCIEEAITEEKKRIFNNLTPWQIVELARHPHRPQTLDIIDKLVTQFTPLKGDRHGSECPATIGGMGYISGRPCMIIGQQKGRTTEERIMHNFGMAQPEGYRKALRLMKLAEKFNLPVVTLIDTPGAYPGIAAEMNNQSEAIARNLFEMAQLKTPLISIVIGEGMSGGALALGMGDINLMCQYAIYSVISPEGCASILWKDSQKKELAAKAMQLTAPDLYQHNLIDGIIEEPLGGGHYDPNAMVLRIQEAIVGHLDQLNQQPRQKLVANRRQKYRMLTQTQHECA
ncbi:MAG: acetyl-CoA carboxylase carboxyltransferase subunit alpha [Candidatus Comchoanobacterales bacterium]